MSNVSGWSLNLGEMKFLILIITLKDNKLYIEICIYVFLLGSIKSKNLCSCQSEVKSQEAGMKRSD